MAPYRTDKSASPAERQHSLSPDPVAAAEAKLPPLATAPVAAKVGYKRDVAGPSKRAKLTDNDFQRLQVEKLLANPEREVELPQPVREKQLRDPHEMMKNVQSSAAGAGSGEFHVYKASRRREFERVKIMEDKGRALEEQAAFLARQQEREAITEAKTAKNRAKRQKRKAGKKGDEKDASPLAGPANGAGTKRKLAGGADGFVVPRAGEERDGSDEEEEARREEQGVAVTEAGVGNLNIPIPSEGGAIPVHQAPEVVERPVAEEPGVVIHDDE